MKIILISTWTFKKQLLSLKVNSYYFKVLCICTSESLIIHKTVIVKLKNSGLNKLINILLNRIKRRSFLIYMSIT